MRILITGICGFVGSTLAKQWAAGTGSSHEIIGIDNLSRPGSELHKRDLLKLGIRVIHGDIRSASDVSSLPKTDAVIDAAANPSVLAGLDGKSSSRQLVEHNLQGTLNLLEYCREHTAAFVMLSTSRVYNIPAMLNIPVIANGNAFSPSFCSTSLQGFGPEGIEETFATGAPCSLYGATKLASENMALEYGLAFNFPVFINRCGVLAGAGQFGKADQGIFSFWIHSWLAGAPLKYIGFEGKGHQVRDCLHPADLIPLIDKQLASGSRELSPADRVINLSGGMASTMSLAQLSDWCENHFKLKRNIKADLTPRPFDLPWVVLSAQRAQSLWQWQPARTGDMILNEIADHALAHPQWLETSSD